MHKLAFYDMDKTITRKATFGPFILYVLRRYRPWRVLLLPVMGLVTLAYGAKLLSRSRLKEINLQLLLGSRLDRTELEAISKGFAAEVDLLPKALARMSDDRDEGYRIVLATASFRFYVEEIARALGVTDVIATDCEVGNAGVMLPKIEGENCYEEGKLRMVKSWLAGEGLDRSKCHIRFYSDHVSDTPCLAWADEAFAANPHPPLKREAAQRGWGIFYWLS